MALKNVVKNTRVTASATFDHRPRPSHSTKIGASTTRGIALKPLMKGSRIRAERRLRPSHTPPATPSAVPMT